MPLRLCVFNHICCLPHDLLYLFLSMWIKQLKNTIITSHCPRRADFMSANINMFAFSIISQHWDNIANYNPPLSLQWRHNERDGVSNQQRIDCLLNLLFRRRSKKTSKLHVTGLCEGNSPVTGEFPAQRTSNAENISIWWCHHVKGKAMLFRHSQHHGYRGPGAPFYLHGLTIIPAWISNHMTSKVWDEITSTVAHLKVGNG